MRSDVVGRDPFREFVDVFDSWRSSLGPQVREARKESQWQPACDVSEDDNAITVIAEVPGVKLEDIDIEVTADGMTIQGERPFPADETSWVRVERSYGKFSRSFSISIPINVGGVTASYKDGLLMVSIPKSEDVKPKRIAVEAG